MQHAKADDIVEHIYKAIDECKLNLNKLLMLGCDGPYVNKKVQRTVSADLISKRNAGLIDIGTCNIHIINNSFLKGLDQCGSNAADLIVAIKRFFKDRPSRIADYERCQKKVGVPKNKFIKHVESRWTTIEPACTRLIEQWPAVVEYFLKYIPKEEKHVEKTLAYKTIKDLLNKQTIKAEIRFVASSAKLFLKFTTFFQNSAPLIHLIYDEVWQLFVNLTVRFCKPETINSISRGEFSNETFHVNNLIELTEYEALLGREIFDELIASKVQKNEMTIFANKVRKHYIAACEHIVKKFPLFEEDCILKQIRCIKPDFINKSSTHSLVQLAKILPNFTNFSELEDEWKLLQLEKLPENFTRIDHFWNELFNRKVNGITKYPHVKKVVQSFLSLSHGSADVERGFSLSARILTSDRNSLNEKSMNSIFLVKDAIHKIYDGKVENIEITPELYLLAKNARGSYEAYLEERRREKEAEEKAELEIENQKKAKQKELQGKEKEARNLKKLENSLREIQHKETTKKKAAKELLDEAELKLSKALRNNNLVEANIAQGLIQAAKSMLDEEAKLEEQAKSIESNVNKRKSDLLAYFSKKVKT